MRPLPPLDDWRETRDTLHSWSRFLGALRAQIEPKHPRFWHGSLRVSPEGLSTGEMDGGIRVTLDLRSHQLALEHERERELLLSLSDQPTTTQLGERLLERLSALGREVALQDDRWRSDAPARYDAAHGASFLDAVVDVEAVFQTVAERIGGRLSPVQLWPHHFDLSFERFGTREVTSEEGGERTASPAQVGYGWSTGDGTHQDAYFYANPWPFESRWLDHDLPHQAKWITEGFEGSLFPASASQGEAAERAGEIEDYFGSVWALARGSIDA